MPFQIPQIVQPSSEKRIGDNSTQPAAKKAKGLPPIADLVEMEAAPKRQAARRLPAVAPLNVCIYKVQRPLYYLCSLQKLSCDLLCVENLQII